MIRISYNMKLLLEIYFNDLNIIKLSIQKIKHFTTKLFLNENK